MFPFRQDILVEHADEAAFLFRQRARALGAWNQDLDTLAELEERLLAHLDGLVIAGDEGWAAVAKGLGAEKDDEAFVSAYVAATVGTKKAREALRAALPEAKAPGGLARGMALARQDGVLTELIEDKSPLTIAIAVDALSFRSAQPSLQAKLAPLLDSEDPRVVGCALAARARLRGRDQLQRIEKHLRAREPRIAYAALRAGVLCESATALESARTLAERSGPLRAHALWLVAMNADGDDEPILRKAIAEPASARSALLGLGRLGLPESAPALVECVALPLGGRAAAHGLETMFGVSIERERWTAPAVRPADPFADDPDEDLLPAEPAKVAAWWKSNSTRFAKNARARLRQGEPFRLEHLTHEAEHARMPDRGAALLECLLRVPAAGYYESEDWVSNQRARWSDYRARLAAAVANKSGGRP